MKTNRRATLGVAAATVLSLALAGCGGSSTSEEIEQMEGGAETGIENDIEDVPGEGTGGEPSP